MAEWPWAGMVADPGGWVAASADPGARWLLFTAVRDLPDDSAEVRATRAEMLGHPDTGDLLARLDPWDSGAPRSGHDDPRFAPNLLTLLADRGLRAGDDPRVDAALDAMLEHQDDDGRFQSYCARRRGEAPAWSALLCDTHAVTELLLRYGPAHRRTDPRTTVALARMAVDLTTTAQGPAWLCRPDPVTGFRGPGRRGDMCPQVTLEALRAFSHLPDDATPSGPLDVARTVLRAWDVRGTEQPQMFGHGSRFKTGKWPPTWYSALEMVEVLGRYPALWRGPRARAEDRRALAELAACLVAYTMGPDGRVTPRSTFRGFEAHSFGQKREPSPFATAVTLRALHRLDDLAPDAAAVNVHALGSSKGGSGAPRPPATPGRMRA
ncbi:hypothetical protein GXB85_16670 [Cellulomonas sp. APG4]|uniref:hypothetical protein n=1 Tax=Cellulomonas sp. APG4 TaxID=1538656 RepID=UPI00137AF370|nr:hypothetical protein [Cellulomonas sp. APG4]NCT92569.1 hypothetical protein [Cellulomonas sp. APG4]